MSYVILGAAAALWLATHPARLDAFAERLDVLVVSRLPEGVAAPLKSLLQAGGAGTVVAKSGAGSLGSVVLPQDARGLGLAGFAHPYRRSLACACYAAAAVLGARFALLAYRVAVPPRRFRHFPTVGMLDMLRAMLSGKGFLDQNKYISRIIEQDLARKTQHSRATGAAVAKSTDTSLRWLFGQWVVTIRNPADIKNALIRHELFDKIHASELGFDDKFLGVSVALAPADEWKRHRKVVNPAFRKKWSTQPFGELMHVMIGLLDEEAKAKRAIDPQEWMQRMTLDALAKAVFSIPMDAIRLGARSDLVKLYNTVMEALTSPIMALVPWWLRPLSPMHRRNSANIDKFNAWLFEMIDAKTERMRSKAAAGAAEDRDLLELMIEASQKEDFSREDLRANAVTFFVAGHDTTALALSFALYLLGQHPEVQEKARKEVVDILGDIERNTPADQVPVPTNEEIGRFKYIAYVMKEVMRLYPSVTAIPMRRLTGPYTLHDGTHVPAGTYVSMDVLGAHYRRESWGADTDQFRPERWDTVETASRAEGGGGGKKKDAEWAGQGLPAAPGEESVPMHPMAHNYTWLPFGGGQRICLGQQFSIIEQKVVLAMMLLRYTWKVTGNARALVGDPDTKPGFLLHSRGISIELARRDTATGTASPAAAKKK